jgi:UDP-N-acetylmuramate: L-alanyl-gamma-D-glutamyl-meso-diaminopimelate ligase
MSSNLEPFSQREDWVHFTGIGGIAVGQVAIAFATAGYFVTGSDQEIFEPMKSMLAARPEIKVTNSYSYDNLLLNKYSGQEGDNQVLPGLVVAGGGLSLNNKELLFAAKRGLKVQNYAEVLEEKAVVAGKSIVVAGSFGKTTTTSLLIKIFEAAGKNASYMVGGLVADLEQGVKLRTTETEYSILEGDEYISSRSDMQSKFFHYHPDILVITGYAYDHTDVFTTPESYYDNFAKLVGQLPTNGLLVINGKYEQLRKLAESAACKVVSYEYSADGFDYNTKLLGDFNRENVLAAATTARELGIADESIRTAVASYQGVARRLQVVGKGEGWIVIDDFGATPAKAKAAIAAVQKEFPAANIIAIFEPNIGNRTQQALPEFAGVFTAANKLFLQQFAKVNQQGIISEQELAQYLHNQGLQPVVLQAEPIPQLLAARDLNKQNVFLFLSSHGVDKQTAELVAALQK